jgi:hypothetical protein
MLFNDSTRHSSRASVLRWTVPLRPQLQHTDNPRHGEQVVALISFTSPALLSAVQTPEEAITAYLALTLDQEKDGHVQ